MLLILEKSYEVGISGFVKENKNVTDYNKYKILKNNSENLIKTKILYYYNNIKNLIRLKNIRKNTNNTEYFHIYKFKTY